MKKLALFLLIIVMTSMIVTASEDTKFINALKTCSAFSENGQVKADGQNAASSKQILGWKNDKCVYKEKINYSGIDIDVTCSFTKDQIKELSSVMGAYDLLQQYSKDDMNIESVEQVQNNPVVKAWNKYLQNPEVCTIGGLE